MMGKYTDIKDANKVLNHRERADDQQVIESLPLVAKIEVTNKCNLRCVMCRDLDDSREPKLLDVDVFKRLEPIFPTLLSAYLYGIGEVLTYPHVDELIDMLLSYDVNTGVITNGMLITERHVNKWVNEGLYRLSVSLDGATKATYEKIRRGGNFERVLGNVAMVRDLKRKLGVDRPVITFNFVVMRDNLSELCDFVDLAVEYGAEEIVVSDLIVFFDELRDQAVSHDEPLCQDTFLRAKQRAEEVGINLVLPAAFRFKNGQAGASASRSVESNEGGSGCSSLNRCTEVWSGIWLTADGIVTPCCYWERPMGDLKRDDFLTIWNGEQYQGLRKIVNTDMRPLHCRTCAIAGMEQRKD